MNTNSLKFTTHEGVTKIVPLDTMSAAPQGAAGFFAIRRRRSSGLRRSAIWLFAAVAGASQ